MKAKLAAALLAASLLLPGAASFADDSSVENGPLTTDHPVAWGITSLPLRATTAAGGVGVGLITGTGRGIWDAEKKFAETTWAEVPEKPWLAPIGLIGTVVAVPVGIVMGAPKEAADYGSKSWRWWNRF